MELRITIPTRRYLKKWLAASYPVEPFVISTNKNPVADFMFNTFSKTYIRIDADSMKYLDDTLEIVIPDFYAIQNQFHVGKKHALQIDRFLRDSFYRTIYEAVNLVCEKRGDKQALIFKILASYGITEEDVQFETIRKALYRYDMEREKLIKDKTDIDGCVPDGMPFTHPVSGDSAA